MRTIQPQSQPPSKPAPQRQSPPKPERSAEPRSERSPAPRSNDLSHALARLRFRHLHMLDTLADTGTLSATAQRMHLSQSALSKMLQEVESVFGFALFERLPRGLTPTARGALVTHMAATVLHELAHTAQQVAHPQAMPILRLGAPPFVAQAHVPAILRTLLAEQPCQVELTERGIPRLFELLGDGRLDALITGLPAQPPRGQRLTVETLFSADMVVIAARGHALARAVAVDWAALQGERWIMPADDTLGHQVLNDVFRRAGVLPPELLLTSNNPATNVELVATGLGLALVPQAMLARVSSARHVRVLHMATPWQPAAVALVHRVPSPLVDALRRAVQRTLAGGR